MTYPSVVGTATGGDNTAVTSLSVPLPSSIVAGDLLVIYVAVGAKTTAPTFSTPTGWTAGGSLSSTTVSYAFFHKTASGSEGSSVTVTASETVKFNSTSWLISGWNAVVFGTDAFSNINTGVAAPAISPSWGSATTLWVICNISTAAPNTVSSYPSGFTSNETIVDTATGSGGNTIATSTADITTATETPGAITWGTTSQVLAVMFAVQPGGGTAYSLSVAEGAFTLTGKAVTLSHGMYLVAAEGAFAFTGELVKWATAKFSGGASFALTGKITNALRVWNAAHGTFTLNGIAASLGFSHILVAAEGAFAMAGKAVSWAASRFTPHGSFALTGYTISMAHNRFLTAAEGAFSFIGEAATFSVSIVVAYMLAAAQGAFNLFGGPTLLNYVSSAFTIGVATLSQNRSQQASLSMQRSVSFVLNKLRNFDPQL